MKHTIRHLSEIWEIHTDGQKELAELFNQSSEQPLLSEIWKIHTDEQKEPAELFNQSSEQPPFEENNSSLAYATRFYKVVSRIISTPLVIGAAVGALALLVATLPLAGIFCLADAICSVKAMEMLGHIVAGSGLAGLVALTAVTLVAHLPLAVLTTSCTLIADGVSGLIEAVKHCGSSDQHTAV